MIKMAAVVGKPNVSLFILLCFLPNLMILVNTGTK